MSFAAGRSTRREDRNGRLGGRIDNGIVDIDCRGVELAGKFSTPQPRRRGFGGRGWKEHVEPDEGYAPVVSLEDSTMLSLRVARSVIHSLQDDVLAESIETGVSTTDLTMVIVNIACCGVERGCNCVSLRARPRGHGGRGRPECVQLNKGYAPGTSSDDSTRLKLT